MRMVLEAATKPQKKKTVMSVINARVLFVAIRQC